MSALRRPCPSGPCARCDAAATVAAVVVRDPEGDLSTTDVLARLGLSKRAAKVRAIGVYDYVTETGEVVYTGSLAGVNAWLVNAGHWVRA